MSGKKETKLWRNVASTKHFPIVLYTRAYTTAAQRTHRRSIYDNTTCYSKLLHEVGIDSFNGTLSSFFHNIFFFKFLQR